MSFGNRLWSGVFAVCVALTLSGCLPSGQNQSEEEKEPHFVLGKSRINAMDYQGAVEAFQEALEANPHLAAAHFELGWLYDEKESDPAAAIYHYQQYLKLNPDAGNTEVIKQRIESCKQQLAADVLPLLGAPAAQQQLEKLADQNHQLQAQVDHLNDVVKRWNAWYASQQAAARTNSTPAQIAVAPQPTPVQQVQTASAQTGGATAIHTMTAVPRAHTVVAGETAMAICRKTGVKFSSLQAANPGVNLGRIRAGQILNLPPP